MAAAAGAGASGKPAERYPFDVAVAIDFGTHGTAYSVAFPPSHPTDLDVMAKEIIPIKPGEAAGSADKQLTALLLDAKSEHTLISFGAVSRERFADMCDNPRAEPALHFHTFKMALVPGGTLRRGHKNLQDIMIDAVGRTSSSGGEGSGAVPAALLVQRVLEFVRKDAMAFLETRMRATDVAKLRIMWVLTVPAIWDDEAKAFMRHAAFAAGLTKKVDDANLMLALEPEAAVLASIADCAPSERARFVKGTRLMIVDCGGGTVDITCDEIVEAATPGPLELKEIAAPSGGAWGATSVDKGFMRFLKDLLGDKFKQLDSRVQLDVLSDWEAEKMGVTGDDEDADTVFVRMHEIIDNLNDKLDGFGKADMEELIAAYNSRYGLTDDEQKVSFTKAKKLRIPPSITRRFFTDVIGSTVTHVTKLLAAVGRIDAIMVAGGFAESKILQKLMKDTFENESRAVILPKRPGKVVVMGAGLFALQPRVIKERMVRWSYAYLGAEPYDPAVHDEAHVFVTGEGRRLVNILYPLVQKGERVEVGQVCTRAGLIPVRADQEVIDFELYRVDDRLVDPRTEARKPRTVVVDDRRPGGPGRNQEVSRRDKVAMLTITIGARDKPRKERTVDLKMAFGNTEVVASAVSASTGEERHVKLTYM